MHEATLEERVTRVEKQLAELANHVTAAPQESNWVDRITGSFAETPEFDEVLRLGREIRQSDRPADS